jgi:4-hydroxybenzoate polyprenyltransferase
MQINSTTFSGSSKSTFADYLHLLRVRQWAKNLLLFAGFVFAGRLRAPLGTEIFFSEISRVILAFLCFCALSSATYILNDWLDAPLDRLHPLKKNRPLASGAIGRSSAALVFFCLLIVALLCALQIIKMEPRTFAFPLIALAYFLLFVFYSFLLKHHVIVDVLCVAIGFVLRVAAGCLAIPVYISPWILLCTFNLALFVALCKRRAELAAAGENLGTRKVLSEYSLPLLDPLIAACASLAVIAYSLYTFSASHVDALGALQNSSLLMLTIPLVVYGIFRYWYLALNTEVGEAPEKMLFDVPLIINGILWILAVVILTILAQL